MKYPLRAPLLAATATAVLALAAAVLFLFPAKELAVYGNFSDRELRDIKRVAVRHTRSLALANLRRAARNPMEIPGAVRAMLDCRVLGIDRCWNDEVCVHVAVNRLAALQRMQAFCVLVNSNGVWHARSGGGFPPPREPVADADPSRRSRVSIRVPTGLRIARQNGRTNYVFTGFEAADITVGHKMITGWREEVHLSQDGKPAGTIKIESCGEPLPAEIPPIGPGGTPHDVPESFQFTIFESDQPPAYHVGPDAGKYYRVLWTRVFNQPFE